jgi:hypothetical protein
MIALSCFWVNINENDGPGRLSGTNGDWSAFGHSTCQTRTWNDCVSSIDNNGVNRWSKLWVDPWFSGGSLTIGATGCPTPLAFGDAGSFFYDSIRSNSCLARGGGTNSICIGPA